MRALNNMGCDWISGDFVAFGYGVEFNDMFTNDDRTEYISHYVDLPDEDQDDAESSNWSTDDSATEEKQDGSEEYVAAWAEFRTGQYNPMAMLSRAWVAHLAGRGLINWYERGIRPHVGVTIKPGEYESLSYKDNCMIVFGIRMDQDIYVTGTVVGDEMVVQPAISIPMELHEVTEAFVRKFGCDKSAGLRLMRVLFVK